MTDNDRLEAAAHLQRQDDYGALVGSIEGIAALFGEIADHKHHQDPTPENFRQWARYCEAAADTIQTLAAQLEDARLNEADMRRIAERQDDRAETAEAEVARLKERVGAVIEEMCIAAENEPQGSPKEEELYGWAKRLEANHEASED